MMSFGPLISYIVSFLLPAIVFLVIAIVKKKKEWYAVSISCFGCALAFAISLFAHLLGKISSYDGGIIFASVLIFLGFVPVLILAFVKRKRIFAVSSIVLSVALSMAAIAPIVISGSSIASAARETQRANNQTAEENTTTASVPSAYDEDFLRWCLEYGLTGVTYGENGPLYVRAYPQTVVDDASLINALNNTRRYNNIVDYNGSLYYCAKANPATDNVCFNNGENIIPGTPYYFEIQPIEWRIMESQGGISYTISEKIIDAMAFPQNLWDCMNYISDPELDPDGKEGPVFDSLEEELLINETYRTILTIGKDLWHRPMSDYPLDNPVYWTFENDIWSYKTAWYFSAHNDVHGYYCLPSYTEAEIVGNITSPDCVTDFALARGANINEPEEAYPYWLRSISDQGQPVAYPYETLTPNDKRGVRPVAAWPTGYGL